MNLCPLCPPSHTVLDLPQSPANMRTHRPTLSFTAEQVEAVIGNGVSVLTPGSQRSTKEETGSWKGGMEGKFTFMYSMKWRVEDEGKGSQLPCGFPSSSLCCSPTQVDIPSALPVWSRTPSHSQTIGINPETEGPGAQRCQRTLARTDARYTRHTVHSLTH